MVSPRRPLKLLGLLLLRARGAALGWLWYELWERVGGIIMPRRVGWRWWRCVACSPEQRNHRVVTSCLLISVGDADGDGGGGGGAFLFFSSFFSSKEKERG